MGRRYTVPLFFSALAAAAQLVQVLGAANKITKLKSVRIEESSDYADAQAEGLRIQIERVGTPFTAGTTITAQPCDPGDAAATFVVRQSPTTNGPGTETVLVEGGMNEQAGWQWAPPEGSGGEITIVGTSVALTVKLATSPIDPIDVEMTLELEEIG